MLHKLQEDHRCKILVGYVIWRCGEVLQGVWHVSKSNDRWHEDYEFGKIGDYVTRGIIYEMKVGFHGTHQTNW